MKLGSESQKVQSIFSSIAPSYDLVNDLMTFGLARRWRSQLVKSTKPQTDDHVLDCATGTGDVAIEFKRQHGEQIHVTGCDFSSEMLALAPGKAAERGMQIEFQRADVSQLPYKDQSFNICTIAYGLRNVHDRSKGIQEMVRVLKTDGRLAILETGRVESPVLRFGIELFFKHIVPWIGGLFSGQRSAYEYLNSTSVDFPGGEDMRKWLLEHDNIVNVEAIPLMGGASYIYLCKVHK